MLDDPLQARAVRLVKSGQPVTVDIQDSDDRTVGSEDRNDDLASRSAAAGDVSRELLHVRDDDGFLPGPGRPADTLRIRDMHAGDGSLERSQDQFLTGHPVETGPPETEGFVQDGSDVRHLGDDVCLPFRQGSDLALQGSVFFGLFHYNFFVRRINKNVSPIV